MTGAVDLQTKPVLSAPVLSEQDRAVFLKEAIDLFKRNRQGHFIHRMYMSHASLQYWAEFMKHRGYYVTRSERNLISGFARVIGNLANHPDGVIGIENGPGTVSAIKAKSAVFFSAMPHLHTYVGRDWSPEVVKNVTKTMPLELSGTRVIGDVANYLQSPVANDLGPGRKVMAEFGVTRGNMEGFPHNPFPAHILRGDLAFHREQLAQDDLYVVTFDANQNERTITEAYSSEWLTLWGRELFWSMLRELPIEGDFDPESFVFRPIWYAENHISTNNMIALRNMQFSIGGVRINVNKGEPFGITNSFKIPVPVFLSIAMQAGFAPMHTFQDAEKRMTMAVLKAVV